MLCGVGTYYRDRLTARLRRVDLGGASFMETADILSRRIEPLFLTLHSFSLLKYDRSRTRFAPFPEYAERLRRFCGLACEKWGYRPATALEAVESIHRTDEALPWTELPTTATLASCAGILKSLRGRLRA